MGGLEEAFAVLAGAGVRAFFSAEELGLQQILRDGAAVDGHHRTACALAMGVQRLRDQFFTRARFSAHQDRSHAAGDFGDPVTHLLHGCRLSDEGLDT